MSSGKESSKKRKKSIYKDSADSPTTPAKRFKPASEAENIPDLNASEALYEGVDSYQQHINGKPSKKNHRVESKKKKNEEEEEKTYHSPLLLVRKIKIA